MKRFFDIFLAVLALLLFGTAFVWHCVDPKCELSQFAVSVCGAVRMEDSGPLKRLCNLFSGLLR